MRQNDSPCGSTIGPIISTHCALLAADIGAPMLSMHSIRETCSCDDLENYATLMGNFYRGIAAVMDKIRID